MIKKEQQQRGACDRLKKKKQLKGLQQCSLISDCTSCSFTAAPCKEEFKRWVPAANTHTVREVHVRYLPHSRNACLRAQVGLISAGSVQVSGVHPAAALASSARLSQVQILQTGCFCSPSSFPMLLLTPLSFSLPSCTWRLLLPLLVFLLPTWLQCLPLSLSLSFFWFHFLSFLFFFHRFSSVITSPPPIHHLYFLSFFFPASLFNFIFQIMCHFF